MSSNTSVIADEAGEFDDWIEIYNAGATPVDLNGYYISDDFSEPDQFQFSVPLIIPASGFLLIWADDDEDQGTTHTNFKLNSDGEQIILTAPNGVTIVDSFTIPVIPEDLTYGRLTDGGNQLDILSPPSPDSSNNNSLGRTLKPIISLASGSYSGNQTITIESETGSTIYYTTDGSIPSMESDVYTDSITINSSSSVRAIAVKPGFEQSFISTHSYLIDFASSLPVLFITMDPVDLYSDTAGIYVTGTNGITGYCSGEIVRNWNQDWERQAHLKVFIDGGVVAENNLGIKIGGNCKRIRPQKPLNLNFKDEYGDDGDNEFNYQIFPDNDLDKFKRLYLRTGNGEFQDLMKDVVIARMMESEIDIETQAGQPTIVFINGEYIGIQNLREKYDRWHFEQDYDKVIDRDSIDIIRNPGRYYPASNWWAFQRATHGDTTAYREFVNYLTTVDFTNQSEFEKVSTLIDYDELLNYISIGHFFAISDWVGNNEKVWRSRQTNGKWRWCLVDFDTAIKNENIAVNTVTKLLTTTPRGYAENAEATLLYRGMFSNNTFRYEYIQRMNTYLELLFVNEKFDPIIDGYYTELLPDLPLANDLFGHTLDLYQSEIQDQKDFVSQRAEYVRQHLSSTFAFTDTIELSFNVDANSKGNVNLHSNYYKIPDNYRGWYHRNIPLEIHAVPDPGYRFSHWQETGDTNANLYQSFDTDTSLTPIFVPAIDLVINEIYYNPSGSSEAPEFIELYNPDTEAKPLDTYKFSDGICFEFPQGFMIGAREYIIIAHDASLYEGNAYQVFEWETSKLNNDGERLHLVNRNEQTIDSVDYDDESPWSSEPEQGIKSLALIDAHLDNSLPENWCVQPT
ncbi:MAG: lamin tail domain-containing protein, partial [Bacteroidota bacterium]